SSTNMKRIIAIAGLGVMLLTAAAGAHHAFSAEFDQNKPVQLEGALTKADWMNPHAWIYIDVKGADGNVVNWAIEMGPPSALLRRGSSRRCCSPSEPDRRGRIRAAAETSSRTRPAAPSARIDRSRAPIRRRV